MKYLICNWKNYVTLPDGSDLLKIANAFQKSRDDIRVVVLPDDFHVGYFHHSWELDHSDVLFWVQSVSPENQFPHTGDVSFAQLHENIEYVLVGHAERRRFEKYNQKVLQEKIHDTDKFKKKLIYCVWESNKTLDLNVIKEELQTQLEPLVAYNSEVLLCYEPIWAIGGAQTPWADLLSDMMTWTYEHATEILGHDNITMLYGWGVWPDSIDEFLTLAWCHGVILGSSCTKKDTFIELLENIA